MIDKSALDRCDKLFKAIPKDAVGNKPVHDGIVELAEYSKAKYKILWILKEVNDTMSGGGWDLCDFLSNSTKVQGASNWRKTYGPVARATYGILNDMPTWNKLLKEDESKIIEALKQIAVINLKKTPGGGKSNDKAIAEAYDAQKELIHCQIETFKPDIIIGGKILYMLYPYFNIEESDMHMEIDDVWYNISKGRLLIDAYHPAQRGAKDSYYTALIKAVKKGLKLLQK